MSVHHLVLTPFLERDLALCGKVLRHHHNGGLRFIYVSQADWAQIGKVFLEHLAGPLAHILEEQIAQIF
jgi:hypothetical protein